MQRMLVMSVVLFASCVAYEPPAVDRETIRVPGSLEGLPFSSAVRAGNMLYLSGQIGTLPGTTDLISGGVAAETRQTLDNIRTVLEHAGSGLERVVKCTVFLADIADYGEVNAVYAEFFASDPPARSAVAGSGLALGARVEIECLATVPERS
jgi:2-iminobutanoate/2-iminopropanoate deaminase